MADVLASAAIRWKWSPIRLRSSTSRMKRMFRPCDHRLRLGQLSDGDLPGAAIAEEIGGAQRPRFVAMGQLRPGKKPRFAGEIERRCRFGIAAQQLFVAVLPQPQRGMAGQGEIGTAIPVRGPARRRSGSGGVRQRRRRQEWIFRDPDLARKAMASLPISTALPWNTSLPSMPRASGWIWLRKR